MRNIQVKSWKSRYLHSSKATQGTQTKATQTEEGLGKNHRTIALLSDEITVTDKYKAQHVSSRECMPRALRVVSMQEGVFLIILFNFVIFSTFSPEWGEEGGGDGFVVSTPPPDDCC